MNLSDSVNSVGLVFDILGVLILFKYGLPSKIKTPPTLLVQSNLGDKEIL